MLVLSRNIGKSIMLGDDVKITVLACHGGQVKIGIDAPNDVKIYREEIYLKMQAEKDSKDEE